MAVMAHPHPAPTGSTRDLKWVQGDVVRGWWPRLFTSHDKPPAFLLLAQTDARSWVIQMECSSVGRARYARLYFMVPNDQQQKECVIVLLTMSLQFGSSLLLE
jgi:hypothetical protein